MKNILIITLFATLLVSCSNAKPISTETAPAPSPTKMIAPTSTAIPTFTPTAVASSTPPEIPTLQFYSINPTVVATAESCSVLPEEICVAGMEIKLSGRKLDKYTVIASWPGFSGTEFECPQKALLVNFGENMAPVICDNNSIFFVTVGLTEVTLELKWEGGSFSQTLHPVYEVEQPQGPDCNPQCFIGKAKIVIP